MMKDLNATTNFNGMTKEEFLERIDEIMCGTSNAERAYLENLYNEVVTPHWTKVEDDLPKINPNGSEWEYSDDVLVTLKDGSIAVGRYERDNSTGEHYWWLYGVDQDLIVTHWMCSPESPKKGDREMKKELRFCIEYVCPTHPLNDDGSVNVRHFRTLSEEEAENALVLLLECGCKLIDLYRGNVQDGKLDEWSPLPMIVNQNEDFYVDGDFDSYLNKGD